MTMISIDNLKKLGEHVFKNQFNRYMTKHKTPTPSDTFIEEGIGERRSKIKQAIEEVNGYSSLGGLSEDLIISLTDKLMLVNNQSLQEQRDNYELKISRLEHKDDEFGKGDAYAEGYGDARKGIEGYCIGLKKDLPEYKGGGYDEAKMVGYNQALEDMIKYLKK